jgi:hypothetical protein
MLIVYLLESVESRMARRALALRAIRWSCGKGTEKAHRDHGTSLVGPSIDGLRARVIVCASHLVGVAPRITPDGRAEGCDRFRSWRASG